MPEGRMLKKLISTSQKLANLKTDSARLLYTWLIPHLDIEGRFSADPLILKGYIVPRLKMTPRKIQEYIEDMIKNKLIIIYKVKGDIFLQLEKFKDFQTLRENRESKSVISPPGELQENSSTSKVNRSKVNESKLNIKPEEEVDIHNILIKVRGLGSIKIKKVIEFLRELSLDFPDVDYVEAINKKITWWQDNPSNAPDKPKTNVLSQLRNWIQLQQKWINESKSQDTVGSKKVKSKTKYKMEYLNQIYALAREKGHKIDKIADVLFGYSEETAKRLQEKFSPEKALDVVLDEIKKGGLS